MRAIPVTLLLAATLAMAAHVATVSAASPIYKWVDEDGVVHYSDQPHPGGTKVELQSAQTYQAPPAPRVSSSVASTATAKAPPYTSCQFSRPENDEVFFNTSTVSGGLRLVPALRGGDRLTITMDGKKQNTSSAATGFVLTVERGSHTLTATVEDPSGATVCTSSVTFHVRQPSVQAPYKANRPKF